MLFGSELFEEYIGQLAMASMASLDIFTEGEDFDPKKLQEKMRVGHFVKFITFSKFSFRVLIFSVPPLCDWSFAVRCLLNVNFNCIFV